MVENLAFSQISSSLFVQQVLTEKYFQSRIILHFASVFHGYL